MKKRKKELAAGILLAMVVQGTALAAETKINENDNGGAQTVNIAINAVGIDNSTENQVYYGVYSTGATADTTINLHGAQQITFSAINSLGTETAGSAYGIYTDAGAKATWIPASGDSLNITTYGHSSEAYGIYTTGAGSQTVVGEAANKYLDIAIAAYSDEADDQSITNTGDADNSDAVAAGGSAVAAGYGVYADDYAVNDITVSSLSALTTISASAEANGYTYVTSGTDSYEAVGGAAQAGSVEGTNYAIYADNSASNTVSADSVMANMNLNISGTAYGQVYVSTGTGDRSATGGVAEGGTATAANYAVFADNSAANVVTADSITSYIYVSSYAEAAATVTNTSATGTTNAIGGSAKNGTSVLTNYGIYADNGASNIVNAGNMTVTITESAAAYADATAVGGTAIAGSAMGGDLTVTNYGVYANDSAVNKLIADSISINIMSSDYVSASATGDVATAGSVKGGSVTSVGYGIYADNEAVNEISVGSISNSVNAYVLAYAAGEDAGADEAIGGTAAAVGYGFFADNGAVNNVDIDSFSSSVYANSGISALTTVDGSVEGGAATITNYDIYADNGAVNNISAIYLSDYVSASSSTASTGGAATGAAATVENYGIYADNGAINNVTAETVTVNAAASTTTTAAGNTAIGAAATVENYGIYADNAAVNNVAADSIGVYTMASATATATGGMATGAAAAATSYGLYADNSAVNNVIATTISANATASNGVSATEGTAIGGAAVITNYGLYADNSAVNNVTVDTIYAYASAYADVVAGETATDGAVSGAVYGVYGAGDSVTNLYSKTAGGAVSIQVGSNTEELDSTTYAVYLDGASLNLYSDVDVEAYTVDSYTVASPITYLKDANVTFAGYEDYYNPYYNFDTESYGTDVTGSGTFHTYTSATGTLVLEGTNTFTVNTDLVNSESDKLSFATLSNESTGTNYVAVAYDASIIEGESGTITGTTTVIEITDAR